MAPIFTGEDRKEAIELLKRFREFLKSKSGDESNQAINAIIDKEQVDGTIDVLEDWMFIK